MTTFVFRYTETRHLRNGKLFVTDGTSYFITDQETLTAHTETAKPTYDELDEADSMMQEYQQVVPVIKKGEPVQEVEDAIAGLGLVLPKKNENVKIGDDCTEQGAIPQRHEIVKMAGLLQALANSGDARYSSVALAIARKYATYSLARLMSVADIIPVQVKQSIVAFKMGGTSNGPNGYDFVPPDYAQFLSADSAAYRSEYESLIGANARIESPVARIEDSVAEQRINAAFTENRGQVRSTGGWDPELIRALELFGVKS